MTFLTSLLFASSVLQVSVSDVLATNAYVIPTSIEVTVNDTQTLESSVEWRDAVHHSAPASRPQPTGDMELPQISARSAIAIDVDTGRVLWQKNPESEIPVASITKLVTALTWQELYDDKPQKKVAITAADKITIPGSKDLLLLEGATVTAQDLLAATVVGSYNDAAQALTRATGLSRAQFVEAMNDKARRLGMSSTTFVDVTGLQAGNTATAHDVALLIAAAARDDTIQPLLSQKEAQIRILSEERDVYIQSTDALLTDADIDIIGGKTGFTEEAGYCFVSVVKEPSHGRLIAIAVLGAPSDEQRFSDTKTIAQWAQAHYTWPAP